MSLMDKIKSVLDEKVQDKEATILDEADVKYQLDEDGQPILDEDGNPIPVEEEKDDMDDKDDDDDDDMKDDDKKKKEKKDDEVDVKESLAKIFADAKVDESVVADLETLFNAAVDQSVKVKVEAFETDQAKELETVIEDLENRVDKYLTFVAEEWMKENEIEVETGIKVEISENLINSLKGVFEDSYVEVPESKVDLVKEAEETIDNLLTAVDESKALNEALQAELNDIKAQKIVDELSSEMTDTQKEKLGTLIDSVEYKDNSDYSSKVSVIIENYFNKKDDTNLNEDVDDTPAENDRMAMYVNHLRKKS